MHLPLPTAQQSVLARNPAQAKSRYAQSRSYVTDGDLECVVDQAVLWEWEITAGPRCAIAKTSKAWLAGDLGLLARAGGAMGCYRYLSQ